MRLAERDGDLILGGHFELTITYVEDDDLRARARAVAVKLIGDPGGMFYGAPERE